MGTIMDGKSIDVTTEWLYERRACSIGEMAREAGCSANGMFLAIKRFGVERWRNSRGRLCVPIDWLENRVTEGATLYDLIDELHVKARPLRDCAASHGIKLKLAKRMNRYRNCPCEYEEECKVEYWKYGAMRCEIEVEVDDVA
jgi:hypothetical protein